MGKGRPFPAGNNANPDGRPVGSRNLRDRALIDSLIARGDRMAVDLLSQIANDVNELKPLRIQAMIGVAPYQTAKLGLVPQAAPLVLLPTQVVLPHPHVTMIAHTTENIEHVASLWCSGQLDQASADALISVQRVLRDSLVEEAKRLVAEGGPPRQEILISGGLPDLPGTSVIMPKLGGEAALRAAEHPLVVNGEHVREGSILPRADVIPPPGWPDAPLPKSDDDPQDKS
jgi:hypothetical protein